MFPDIHYNLDLSYTIAIESSAENGMNGSRFEKCGSEITVLDVQHSTVSW